MSFTRGVSHFLSAALVLLSMVTGPVQASTVQDSTLGASHSVIPPVGSYDPAGDIGMAADAVGKSQFANIYGGMALVDQGSHVNIYLTKLDPVAERAIQGSAPADNFTFILTPHTENQALEIHQKVIDQATTIQSNGIQLVAWGPDVKTGKEQIRVKGLTQEIADYLTSLFGAENIELQNVNYTLINFDTRSSDSAPWNGGDFITDDSNDCSSGFPASSGSTDYLITASHCYNLGETIRNGSHMLNLGTFYTMGTISNADFSSGGLDAELINTTGYGGSNTMIWTGSSSSPSDDAVSGATTSPVGYQVCQSGAFDGEICGLTIQTSNFCMPDSNGRNLCHLVEAVNTSGGVAAGSGDSGGPVFRFNGSYLDATGIVQGGGSTIACTSYASGRLCSSTLYYTDINPILSEFGITLK